MKQKEFILTVGDDGLISTAETDLRPGQKLVARGLKNTGIEQSGRDAFLPYGRQWIDHSDVDELLEVLFSDWLTTGPKTTEFESAAAEYCQADYAAACSSGTAALHLALMCLDVGPGDEVITTPLTFAATANMVLQQGALPVFSDICPQTLNLDPGKLIEKITSRTKAIIAVDYAGQPCDYDKILEICKSRGIYLIEDAAHALGASWRENMVGSFADLTTFSFHPVKHITTGEGGMVTTQNAEWDKKIRELRNHGIVQDHHARSEKGQHYYEITNPGFNYRISDIQCALGLSQLKKLSAFLDKRRKIAALYNTSFENSNFIKPLGAAPHSNHAYHLYVVIMDEKSGAPSRDELFVYMRNKNIGVNVHYIPVYKHPYYQKRFGPTYGQCPVAEEKYRQIISLPIHYAMEDEDVFRVVGVMEECLDSV